MHENIFFYYTGTYGSRKLQVSFQPLTYLPMYHTLAKFGDLSRHFSCVVRTLKQASSQFWRDFCPVLNYTKYLKTTTLEPKLKRYVFMHVVVLLVSLVSCDFVVLEQLRFKGFLNFSYFKVVVCKKNPEGDVPHYRCMVYMYILGLEFYE